MNIYLLFFFGGFSSVKISPRLDEERSIVWSNDDGITREKGVRAFLKFYQPSRKAHPSHKVTKILRNPCFISSPSQPKTSRLPRSLQRNTNEWANAHHPSSITDSRSRHIHERSGPKTTYVNFILAAVIFHPPGPCLQQCSGSIDQWL